MKEKLLPLYFFLFCLNGFSQSDSVVTKWGLTVQLLTFEKRDPNIFNNSGNSAYWDESDDLYLFNGGYAHDNSFSLGIAMNYRIQPSFL